MHTRGRFASYCLLNALALSIIAVPASANSDAFDEKAVTDIVPNSAWLFGGVVAEIDGRDFTANAQVFFGGSAAEVLAVSEDGETLWVLVPPFVTEDNSASVTVDVLVRDLERDSRLLQGFTYFRRAFEDGLVVNAFFFDPETDFNGIMQLGGGLEASVTIPVAQRGLGAPGLVGGLFRAGNSSLALGTTVVTGVPPVSSFVEFDLHLYEGIPGELPLQAGAPVLQEISDWSYPASDELDRIAVDVPLPSVNLQSTDVQKGLTLWRVRTLFDYRSFTTNFQEFPFVVFETFVLGADTVPNAAVSAPGTDIETMQVRLEGTGAVALRRNTLPPPNVAEALTVDNSAATSGDIAGGATLRLLSPLGGLAWVDRIEFQAVDGDVVSTAMPDAFLTDPGLTGRELSLTVPPAACTGPVNIAVYLKARPQISFAVLPQAFTYTGDAPACDTGAPTTGCPAGTLAPPAPPSNGDALVLGVALFLLIAFGIHHGRRREWNAC